MTTADKIGIVGTGRMGAGIARRLKEVGYTIAALYDLHPQSAQETAKDTGGEVTQSLSRVTELSDVIITVVSDDAAMYQIFGASGDTLLKNAKGKIFVNTATVTPKVHVDIQRLAEAQGAQSLEACMASSIPQARNGTLYLMVAGRKETFERVKPMLEQMSASLKYIGEAGRAAQVKAL
ncbi:MAG: NAD(P)-dependent oxidoreductase, partial [Vulcanimicrobiaceae bacterium]